MYEAYVEKGLKPYSGCAKVERDSHRATAEERVWKVYNVNIPRSVSTFETEDEIGLADIHQDVDGRGGRSLLKPK